MGVTLKLKERWMYVVIPLAAVGGGMKVFIPLYLLKLGGNAFDVGIAFAIASLASIIGSMFWGRAVDVYRNEKFYIVLAFAAALPSLLLLLFTNSIAMAFVAYALYTLFSSAASPSLNILLMGKHETARLESKMAQFNIFTAIGYILAFLSGTGSNYIGILGYLVFMIALDVVGILLAFLVEQGPTRVHSHSLIPQGPMHEGAMNSFVYRFKTIEGELAKILSKPKPQTKGNVNIKPLIYLFASVSLFNLGYYFFYTPYIPFLSGEGMSASGIFVISLVAVLGQSAVFLRILRKKGKDDQHKPYFKSIFYRSSALTMILVSALLSYSLFFAVNIVANLVYGISYGIWIIASWYKLYEKIRGKHAGYYLGLWSATNSTIAVIGSFVAGYIGNFGYMYSISLGILFTVAAGLIVIGRKF